MTSVYAAMTVPSVAAFLAAIAEPTRLRILNCVATAPLFVSDLAAILALPQPTVSRHLRVLRDAGVLRDVPIPPYVIHSLVPLAPPHGRLLRAVLDAAGTEPGHRAERSAAHARARVGFPSRVAGADVEHAG
jgi:ArsR family transcriptional regulator